MERTFGLQLGRLVSNRELPVLMKVKEIIDVLPVLKERKR